MGAVSRPCFFYFSKVGVFMIKKFLITFSLSLFLLFVGSACDGCFSGGFLPRLPDKYVLTVYASDDDSIYRDTRYQPASPIKDIFTNIIDDLIGEATNFPGIQSDLLNPDLINRTPSADENIQTDINNRPISKFYNRVNAYALYGLTAYANASTTPPVNKNNFAFTARRRINYPDGRWEVDTLYYWYSSFSDIFNPSFEGIQIGQFYMQPNSTFCVRNFSDGSYTSFYLNTQDIPVSYTSPPSSYRIDFNVGSSVTCYNADGSSSSLTFPSGYQVTDTYFMPNCRDRNNNIINSIECNALVDLFNSDPTKYNKAIGNRWLTDAECLVGNIVYDSSSNGSLAMAPVFGTTNFYNSYPVLNYWFLSSGGYTGLTPNTNIYNIDPTNIDPTKPPAVHNTDPIYITPITQENVTNYNDYGITYNDVTGKFDIDLAALGAAVGAQLTPEFDANFNGVYESQPDIGLTFDPDNLHNDYNQQFNDLVIDVQTVIDSLKPSPPWVPPTYPAVNTSVYIPAQTPTYSTYAAVTVPSGVISSAGTFMHMGYDIFEDLGLLVIVIPLAILAILWKFTGG